MHPTIAFAFLCGILGGYTTSTSASENSTSNPLHDHVNVRELPTCKGRTTKPCDPFMVPRDCYDIQQICGSKSGIYYIFPHINDDAVEVYCDMKTEHGGWLVFQRRDDGSVDFYRGWNDYKNGFGNTGGEIWLGNQNLYRITTQGRYELRVDMEDFDGERRFAYYDNFEIKGEGENFQLIIGAYEGNAGDSLIGHNNQAFSTKDKDNDLYGGSCAIKYKGAWWYTECHASNLNALYLEGPHESVADGVNWYAWRGYYYSLKVTEMKIRPYGVYENNE